MKSHLRVTVFALVTVAGLVLMTEPPLCAQTVPLPLGSVSGVVPLQTCPAGAATGANCEQITVSCPKENLPDLNAVLAVATPTAPLIGTVILHGGGPGTNFLDSGFPDTYLAGGFNVVQIAWDSDWATANGKGVKNAACRPATVFDYVFKNVQNSSTSIGFCGQGASGGGAALGYSLADYGLSDEFDYVVIAAGPTVSRMDYGCDPPLYTGKPRNLCPLLTDAPFAYDSETASKVNGWEGTTYCGQASPPPNEIDTWADDSIVAPGANFVYPQTAMSWFFCVTPPGVNESTGQGSFLIEQVQPKDPPDVHCYNGGCQGEGVWQNTEAFDKTLWNMASMCKPNHSGGRF